VVEGKSAKNTTNHQAVALGKLREFLVDGTGSER
jgi:hypothetical protein